MLHIDVDEADLVVLERAVRFARALGGRQAVEALGLEDAVDRVPVQVRQEVREDEGEIVEGKACAAAERAHDGALLIGGFPRQLVRPGGAVLAVGRSALAPLADGLGGDAVALGQHAGALVRAGDLGADSRGGTSLGVDGKHQRALRREPRQPSKRQACASIAQRTRSQQRSTTRQLGQPTSYGQPDPH